MAVKKKRLTKKAEPSAEPKKRGRRKGVPNKITGDIKKALARAFKRVGGVKYLEALANSDPRTVCTLLSKIVPQEREPSAAEAGAGGPTIIKLITRVPASPEQPGVLRLVSEEL
jgi:hypothetical protein